MKHLNAMVNNIFESAVLEAAALATPIYIGHYRPVAKRDSRVKRFTRGNQFRRRREYPRGRNNITLKCARSWCSCTCAFRIVTSYYHNIGGSALFRSLFRCTFREISLHQRRHQQLYIYIYIFSCNIGTNRGFRFRSFSRENDKRTGGNFKAISFAKSAGKLSSSTRNYSEVPRIVLRVQYTRYTGLQFGKRNNH